MARPNFTAASIDKLKSPKKGRIEKYDGRTPGFGVRVTDKGVKTNVTLCFSASQALLAAKAGATYVSPFIGRLDDISEDGMELIQSIRVIYDNYGFETQILAASIRHPMHVVQAALAGADVATIPHKVIGQLVKHPLTDIGLAKFLADWEKMKS